jgi:hypothetical protein
MWNPDASYLAHTAETFLESGTKKWHRKTVEWLVVYLMTEAAGTPHNIRHGRSSITLLNGYHEIAQDLKEQQQLPWQRGESVRLVRKYLCSLDELRAIHSITSQKLSVMRALLKDCERIEAEYIEANMEEADDEDTEPMADRVKWAISLLEELDKDVVLLVDHFHTSLGEVHNSRPLSPFLFFSFFWTQHTKLTGFKLVLPSTID